MAVIDLVKWDGTSDVLAYKFPSQDLSTSTQLVVNETQEAFVVRAGIYDGPFPAGRHTLATENLPLLREVIGLPTDKRSAFTAEIWFVNRIVNLNIHWGSSEMIQLQDPKYQVMLSVRAYGQYGIQIQDSKKFLLKLVGTLKTFDTTTLKTYFAGVLTTRIKQAIATAIIEEGISVLEASAHLEEISLKLLQSLTADLDEYGIRLTQFNIQSINLPENDPAVRKLKEALAKKAELGILGMSYQQDRSFDVLHTAAGNEGTAGGIIGAGVGLGVGLGVGGSVAQRMQDLNPTLDVGGEAQPNIDASQQAEKIRLLRQLGELKSNGTLDEEEFTAMKNEILGNI
jgi:membrane protease subunit (stomatin/prohibitin family)